MRKPSEKQLDPLDRWQPTSPPRSASYREQKGRSLFQKGVQSLRRYGVGQTWRKVLDKVQNDRMYRAFAGTPLYSEEELSAQRKQVFLKHITFSIVVPLYNTPEMFLREMIGSVQAQTYGNWELCLADGSDGSHKNVGEICLAYVREDSRIKYRKLEKNLGISGNTNVCLEMATGDYIGLFDHDDLLHPAALHDVMEVICDKNADFIYTDEATFQSPDSKRLISIHYKPDFAPDNLRANNYICHFSVFSRTLLEKAGPFRPEYDGSQDHDMILRLTAQAETICHIPKVLYYWRSHPQSVAMDIGIKEYAVQAGRKAVRDSVLAGGYQAEVESVPGFPAIYRVKYALKERPRISVIIANWHSFENLERCVASLVKKTTYPDVEIILAGDIEKAGSLSQSVRMAKAGWNISMCPKRGNTARLHNLAAGLATGKYLIFLDGNTEIITPEWMEELLMYAQREDIGAVGGKLYYLNGAIRQAGIILGMGEEGGPGYPFRRRFSAERGYMGRPWYSQDMSAVSRECLMISKSLFQEVGEMDEGYVVGYEDVDLCLRLRQKGYLIVWTPWCELYWHGPEKKSTVDISGDWKRFKSRWAAEIAAGDPYFNPNLGMKFLMR